MGVDRLRPRRSVVEARENIMVTKTTKVCVCCVLQRSSRGETASTLIAILTSYMAFDWLKTCLRHFRDVCRPQKPIAAAVHLQKLDLTMVRAQSFVCLITALAVQCVPIQGFSVPNNQGVIRSGLGLSRDHQLRTGARINGPPLPISVTPPSSSCSSRQHAGAGAGGSSTALNLGLLPSISVLQSSLHADPSFCLTGILLLSTFGVSLERKTTIGKALSAPLATMALALIVANIGILPFASPVYSAVNRYLIPLAVPMLLYDSDLRRVFRDTGTLLIAFCIGAVATIVGTLVAYPILPLQSLGANTGWRVACALAARHIGGAINFVAVAETLKIPASAVSAAIAADNVVVALYFAMLFTISKAGTADEDVADAPKVDIGVEGEYDVNALSQDKAGDNKDMNSDSDSALAAENAISLPTLGIAISTASVLVSFGRLLTNAILPAGTSALPLTSVLTVMGATVFPKFFTRIRAAGTALGIICIQMFFAASGASGSIALVLRQAPSLFAFSALQILVHFGFLMTVGRGIFKLPARELYLASNANVGGPTTAAAMAQAKEWKLLVLPALLVGILGYASATPIALALGPILLRLPLLGH